MSTGVSVEHDDQFRDELTALRERNESKPFKDVAPGDWNEAHVVIGPATEQRIREMTGLDVELRGDGTFENSFMQEGNLIIFTSDDDVVRMISTGQYRAFGEGTFSPEAILHGDPDYSPIRIVEPGE